MDFATPAVAEALSSNKPKLTKYCDYLSIEGVADVPPARGVAVCPLDVDHQTHPTAPTTQRKITGMSCSSY